MSQVFTPGFLRTAPSGKYVGVLKYRDGAGVWRQVTRTFCEDWEEAQVALASWREEMEAAAQEASQPDTLSEKVSGPTVEEALRACLEAQLARGRIEKSTHDMQLGLVERVLFPELGSMSVSTLTPAHVQSWLDKLCLELSAGSARLAASTLRKALTRELVLGHLERDPMLGVELPPRTKPSRAHLPKSQVKALEEALDAYWGEADWRSCAVRLALYAGLRAGEVCALRWRDVDLEAQRLSVCASVGRSATGPYLKAPKCPASVRDVPITSALATALSARASLSYPNAEPCSDPGRAQKRCTPLRAISPTMEGESCGNFERPQPDSCQKPDRWQVSVRSDGGKPDRWQVSVRSQVPVMPGSHFVTGGKDFTNPQTLSREFTALVKRFGICDNEGRRATLHTLRRTFATRAISAGIDIRTLADIMGHSRADVTLNVYAGTPADALTTARARLEALAT